MPTKENWLSNFCQHTVHSEEISRIGASSSDNKQAILRTNSFSLMGPILSSITSLIGKNGDLGLRRFTKNTSKAMHSKRFTVWCTLWWGPCFFKDEGNALNLNGECHRDMLTQFLVSQIQDITHDNIFRYIYCLARVCDCCTAKLISFKAFKHLAVGFSDERLIPRRLRPSKYSRPKLDAGALSMKYSLMYTILLLQILTKEYVIP